MNMQQLNELSSAFRRVQDAMSERPDEVLHSLEMLDGRQPGFADLVYMAPTEREYVISKAAERASLEVWELMMLYRAFTYYKNK